MKEHAPVSVIIPCYRSAQTIERAVRSVHEQSLRPAELILVDDASPDETLAELYRLQARHDAGWVKVIALDANGGAGVARNAGWEAASQPYIAFLDADDSWHPEKICIQYRTMASNPKAVLSGHAYHWRSASNPAAAPKIPQNPDISVITPSRLLLKNRFSTPTVMLKTDVPFRFVAGKRYCEDYDLWLQIVLGGYMALFIEAPLAYLFKAPYGESGLSSHLTRMEQGELGAYWHLFRTNKLDAFSLGLVVCWSASKFMLRLAVNPFRNRLRSQS